MKNKTFLLGILAMVLVLGMVSCGGGIAGGSSGGTYTVYDLLASVEQAEFIDSKADNTTDVVVIVESSVTKAVVVAVLADILKETPETGVPLSAIAAGLKEMVDEDDIDQDDMDDFLAELENGGAIMFIGDGTDVLVIAVFEE